MKIFISKQGNKIIKRKARTFHNCFDCLEQISPNQEYYSIIVKDDFNDYFNTVKICENCWKGREMSANNPKTYKTED